MKYILVSAVAAAFMVGCGGGGGGGGGSGFGAAPATVTTLAPVDLAPLGSVAINGKVTFDFVPVRVTAGVPKLDYAGITVKPARSIAVSLIDGVSGAELRQAFGFEAEQALDISFKPPKLHSDVVYCDDDLRINFGSMGGVYVMSRLHHSGHSVAFD